MDKTTNGEDKMNPPKEKILKKKNLNKGKSATMDEIKTNDGTEMDTERLKEKEVLEAITILKELNQKYFKELKKQPLLEETTESPVFLQLTLKKIPAKYQQRIIKVKLPHSLWTDLTDICLITGDLEKNNLKAESEPVVLHYKELLKKHGVSNVTEVIPLRQLRTEYKDFEARRQLFAAYHMFLADKRIAGCLPKTLGKSFFQKRKLPISINMKSSNLKDQIDNAVSKTEMILSCKGNSCAFQVAHLAMDDKNILENILKCSEVIGENLPGKWDNVLGAYIKTARSKSIPIYMSFGNPQEVKLKRCPRAQRVKAQELSTVLNSEVKVYRDGRVVVIEQPETENSVESKSSNEDGPAELKSDAEVELTGIKEDNTMEECATDIIEDVESVIEKKVKRKIKSRTLKETAKDVDISIQPKPKKRKTKE